MFNQLLFHLRRENLRQSLLLYRVSYSVHEIVSVICFYRTVQKEANVEYLKLRHKIPAAVLFIFFAGQNLFYKFNEAERRLHGLVYGFPVFLHGIKLGCNIWSPWNTVLIFLKTCINVILCSQSHTSILVLLALRHTLPFKEIVLERN